MIIFLYLTLLVNLSIGIFLLKRFFSQKKKNPSTFLWATAFLLTAVAQGLYNPSLNISPSIAFLLFDLSLILLFVGCLLNLTKRHSLLYGLPIALALFSLILHFLAFRELISLKTEMWLGVGLIIIPLTLFLSLVFAMVYAVLSFARQSFFSQLGPLVVSIGFAFYGVLTVLAPLTLASSLFNFWYFLIFIDRAILFLGIYLMDKEAVKLVVLKNRLHGLSQLQKV